MTTLTEREKAILSIHTGYKLTTWKEMLKVAEEVTGECLGNTFLFSNKNPRLEMLREKVKPMAAEIIKRMVEEAEKEPKISFVKTFPARCNGKQFGMYIALYKAGVQDFAERLRKRLRLKGIYPAIVKCAIDDVEKEMTEDE